MDGFDFEPADFTPDDMNFDVGDYGDSGIDSGFEFGNDPQPPEFDEPSISLHDESSFNPLDEPDFDPSDDLTNSEPEIVERGETRPSDVIVSQYPNEIYINPVDQENDISTEEFYSSENPRKSISESGFADNPMPEAISLSTQTDQNEENSEDAGNIENVVFQENDTFVDNDEIPNQELINQTQDQSTNNESEFTVEDEEDVDDIPEVKIPVEENSIIEEGNEQKTQRVDDNLDNPESLTQEEQNRIDSENQFNLPQEPDQENYQVDDSNQESTPSENGFSEEQDQGINQQIEINQSLDKNQESSDADSVNQGESEFTDVPNQTDVEETIEEKTDISSDNNENLEYTSDSGYEERKPLNYKYANEVYSFEDKDPELHEKYPDGVKFNENGYPDFSPYDVARVEIDMKGNYTTDFRDANEAAGFDDTPEGFTWHHNQDGTTMELIPTDLHGAVRHSGGVSVIKNGN